MKSTPSFVLILLAVAVFTFGITRWGVSRYYVFKHDQMIDQIGENIFEHKRIEYTNQEVLSLLFANKKKMYSLLGVQEGLRSLIIIVFIALTFFLVGVSNLLRRPRMHVRDRH